MNFPLYETLNRDLPQKNISEIQEKNMIKYINSLPEEDQEIVFALIKTHEEKNESTSEEMPFNGEHTKDGVHFLVENFPQDLKKILYKFIRMHSAKSREDQKRGKNL